MYNHASINTSHVLFVPSNSLHLKLKIDRWNRNLCLYFDRESELEHVRVNTECKPKTFLFGEIDLSEIHAFVDLVVQYSMTSTNFETGIG